MKIALAPFVLGGLSLLCMRPALVADKQPKAADGFRALQAALAKPDAHFDKLLVRDMVTRRPGVDDVEWQKQFAAELVKAKHQKSREEGKEAVVRYGLEGEEKELPLRYSGDAWIPNAAQGYVVKGKSLDLRRGKKPLRVTLKARTAAVEGYGESAYSFAHVTGDATANKGRVDLWFCHNGDLHLPMSNRLVVVDETFQKAAELPMGLQWRTEVPAVKDAVYIVHCCRQGIRDFFVKFWVVERTAQSVEIEWTLLSDGFGAPVDLKESHPLEEAVGATGADGLCPKKVP